MNPDKLFDYLDGKLPAFERGQLEEQLAGDPELQRELAMARRIHGHMSGESREVLLEEDIVSTSRSRKIVLRVAIAFIALVGINVAAGLWLIARQESANPNRKLLETQMRDQVSKSLNYAAKDSLTPAPLGIEEIAVSAAPGKLETVANDIDATAQRMGGSATKELPEHDRVGVLVDLPANHELEFRNALAAINGGMPASPSPAATVSSSQEKKSFVVHIVEPGAGPH